MVNVRLGSTLNMGDYESFRIDVGITMPCKPTMKDVEQTFENVFKKTHNLLGKKIKQLTGRK
jgi:hypothetical protein